jgi:hypothetical protein
MISSRERRVVMSSGGGFEPPVARVRSRACGRREIGT